ncbi:tyrosine-type recombinase/integrase [Micromonospora chersina]|uniref:tyrosine-type recombinase/integrase n=1 Tax=Micromonospora chersina TaxID=47854 RepID=UPI0033C343E6
MAWRPAASGQPPYGAGVTKSRAQRQAAAGATCRRALNLPTGGELSRQLGSAGASSAPARDRLTAWIRHTGGGPGSRWIGQRGRLTTSGITQTVLAVGTDAHLPGLRPHRLRPTYATRLRQGGADPAQVQALLDHASSTPPPATSGSALQSRLPWWNESLTEASATGAESVGFPK